MTKINWLFAKVNSPFTDVTSSVLSFSYMQGRQNYLDSYTGGILSITLKNQNNIAANFVFNDLWGLSDDTVSAGEQYFFVQGVTFNDAPGNVGMSTITVQLADVLARNGRAVATNVNLAQNNTVDQMFFLNQANPFLGAFNGPTPGGSSTAAAIVYSGNVLDRFNLLMATEKGLVYFMSIFVLMVGRRGIQFSNSGFTFTRNATSATAISYQNYEHERANLNFFNNVTVNPLGLAPQNAINSASFAAFNSVEQSFSTADATTGQALGLAQFLAESQGEPTTETFNVSFIDLPQNATITKGFLTTLYGNDTTIDAGNIRVWDLVSRIPGAGSDTTTKVVIEGINISATPDRTEFTVYLSPLTFYQFFILDSSTLGILDTSRLGF